MCVCTCPGARSGVASEAGLGRARVVASIDELTGSVILTTPHPCLAPWM